MTQNTWRPPDYYYYYIGWYFLCATSLCIYFAWFLVCLSHRTRSGFAALFAASSLLHRTAVCFGYNNMDDGVRWTLIMTCLVTNRKYDMYYTLITCTFLFPTKQRPTVWYKYWDKTSIFFLVSVATTAPRFFMLQLLWVLLAELIHAIFTFHGLLNTNMHFLYLIYEYIYRNPKTLTHTHTAQIPGGCLRSKQHVSHGTMSASFKFSPWRRDAYMRNGILLYT